MPRLHNRGPSLGYIVYSHPNGLPGVLLEQGHGQQRGRRMDERNTGHDDASNEVVLLITGGPVVTMSDALSPIIDPGAVAVRGDRIVDIGPLDEVSQRVRPRRVLERKRGIIMPGIVDSYAHAGHGMIKAIHDQRLGWPASQVYFHGTTPDWWRADGELLGLERLKFGVTTGMSVLGATPARVDTPDYADAHCEGIARVGIRDILGVGPPDDFLLAEWTATDWRSGEPVTVQYTYDQCTATIEEVTERWNGAEDGRITVCLAIAYLCGLNPRFMTGRHSHHYTADDVAVLRKRAIQARELADKLGVFIQTHAYRGTLEFGEECLGSELMDEVLGKDVFFAHGHGFTPRDIDIMARTGSSLSWVPVGPRGVDFGPPPVIDLLKAGVEVAICSDGAGPFFISDVFVNIHRALYLLWQKYQDMTLLPLGKALRMVTIDAARLVGMDDEIGSLDVGKKADIIVIDTNQPHLVPAIAIPQLLTYYVRGNDVETVIVDGNVLMENREVLTVNEEDVLEFAREEIAKALERVDVSAYLQMPEGYWTSWQA
jgi:5-methylthioadenosine/S-adenosylhomocysteine deaminase